LISAGKEQGGQGLHSPRRSDGNQPKAIFAASSENKLQKDCEDGILSGEKEWLCEVSR